MIIYGDSIEQILKENEGLDKNQPIVGVGVEVITKPFNSDKPFFYKTNIKYLYHEDLNSFCSKEHIRNNEEFGRYIVATRANAKMMLQEFRNDSRENILVEVLEGDMYMTKLINVDTIQEVRAFIFDPQEKPWKIDG